GFIGEQIRSQVAVGAGTVMSSGLGPTTFTSIVLTPGIWDITLCIAFNGGTVGTFLGGIIGTVNNSVTGQSNGDNTVLTPFLTHASTDQVLCVPQYRVLVSTNTTYYATGF